MDIKWIWLLSFHLLAVPQMLTKKKNLMHNVHFIVNETALITRNIVINNNQFRLLCWAHVLLPLPSFICFGNPFLCACVCDSMPLQMFGNENATPMIVQWTTLFFVFISFPCSSFDKNGFELELFIKTTHRDKMTMNGWCENYENPAVFVKIKTNKSLTTHSDNPSISNNWVFVLFFGFCFGPPIFQ